MPLVKGKSQAAFKTNVGTLMGEIGKSPHVQSRSQALAIAYSKKRSGKQSGGWVTPDVGKALSQETFVPPDKWSSGLNIEPSLASRFSPGLGARGTLEIAPGLTLEGHATRYGPGPIGDYGAKLRYGREFDAGGAAMNPWMAARYAEGGRSKRYDPPIFENDKPLSYRQPSRREADYYSEDSSSPRSFGEHALAVGRAVFEGDKYREAVSGGRDTRNPLYDRRMRPLGFADGGMANPYAAGGVAPHIPTAPWYERNALRHAGPTKGMLGGASPGRVDNLPINVKSGSYVVPADVVSAIGQGNSKSGAKMMTKMFSGNKMNKYGGGNFRMPGVSGLQRGQFQEGGPVFSDMMPDAVNPFQQYAMELPKNPIEGRPRGTEPGGGVSQPRSIKAYEIWDNLDKKVVSNQYKADSVQRRRARTRADRLNLDYGAHRYTARPIFDDGTSGFGFARGGSPKEHVPIIAASGEFVICPEDVLAFGDGDMKRGHDALDNWVKGQRKKHIDTLRKLKPPKKD